MMLGHFPNPEPEYSYGASMMNESVPALPTGIINNYQTYDRLVMMQYYKDLSVHMRYNVQQYHSMWCTDAVLWWRLRIL
jgi:hypothetical protein